jgi:hypothetical protein
MKLSVFIGSLDIPLNGESNKHYHLITNPLQQFNPLTFVFSARLVAVFRSMGSEEQQQPGFFARLGLAFKVLGDAALAGKLLDVINKPEPKIEAPKVISQEKTHASGLFVLSVLQQDGRLIDFLQQDVASFSDEEVGAAARVVHGGCRKALQRLATPARVMKDDEGATVTVPSGFDSNRIRLTGNVTGQPPFKGTLKHHGWVATDLKFPSLAENLDYRVLAPAEVEL